MSKVGEPNINYEKLLLQFKALLKRNGLKYTSQREIILKTLYTCKEHLTPELLNQLIQQHYPEIKIGIATIYRTLSLLESENMVTSLSFGTQGKKYELGMKQHHDHMICTECETILEFFDDTIERLQEEIALKYGFSITGHSMQLYGLCPTCKAKTQPKERENT